MAYGNIGMVGSPVTRPGYDPITGQFLGTNEQLVAANPGFYFDTDGAIVAGGTGGTPPAQATPQPAQAPVFGTAPQQPPVGGSPASGSGTGNLYGMGLQGLGMGLQPFQAPYLQDVSQSLWNQANQNWNDTINPSIQNQSVMAGNFGDRSEIARGVMMDRLNQSVFNAMAPVYSGAYENWLNRGVQAGNAALGNDLGYGNLGLGYYGADTQRQLGLGNLNLGQYQADTQRQLGMGGLDVSRYNAQTNAAQAAAGAAGVPQYTNPWLAGIGALTSLYPFLFPQQGG